MDITINTRKTQHIMPSSSTPKELFQPWYTKEFSIHENIVFYGCHISTKTSVESLVTNENIVIPNTIKKAVKKRQLEFIAGRYCAKKCMDSYGISTTEIAIGENREPLWPDGIVASISHNQEFALCAASKVEHYSSVGVDIETILTIEQYNDISNQILFDQEFDLIKTSKLSKNTFLSVVFSVKESLFKAIYKDVGYYFGFDAAELIAINVDKNSLKLALKEDLSSSHSRGKIFNAAFYIIQDKVLTIISES